MVRRVRAAHTPPWRMLGAALSLVWGLALTPPIALAQTTVGPQASGPILVVIGDGDASASPDVAIVSFTVQTDADSPDLAVLQNATNVTSLIRAFGRVGVAEEDVRISGVNLSTFTIQVPPRGGGADPSPQQQTITVTMYRAVNTLVVTVNNLARISEVLAVGLAGGAAVSGTPRFAMRDDTELRQQALDRAGRAARAEADALAAALGLRLIGLISATEEQPPGEPPAIGATTQRTRVRLVFGVTTG